jgi:CRP-like cAMP-binding protein
MLFGELGLVNDHPRDATATCREDCEFLCIQRQDFDRILKADVRKRHREKLDFLKAHAPVMRWQNENTSEMVLRLIEHITVPRHHCFFMAGDIPDGSIYFIWEGAVECQERVLETCLDGRPTSRKEEVRKHGLLMKGTIFGRVCTKGPMPYSVVAATAPCEVLRLAPDSQKQLPDPLVQGLRDMIEQAMSRRIERNSMRGALAEISNMGRGRSKKSARGAATHPVTCLPPASAKGFLQLTNGDLLRNMHLSNAPATGPCRRVRPASARGGTAEMVTSARDRDRRIQLRSREEDQRPEHRRSFCSSRAASRAESLSRSPSRSLSPSRSNGFIDTGLRSPSRSNLRSALKESGDRPFVEASLDCGASTSISKAGKNPKMDYEFL